MRRIPAEPLTPLAPSSQWIGYAGAGLAVLAVVAVRLGGVPPLNGLAVLGLALFFAGLAGVCAIAALNVIWRFGGAGVGQAVKGLVLATLVLAAPAYFGALALTLPMLHDVSTDLVDPPSFGRSRSAVDARGGLIPPEFSAGSAPEQRDAYPGIRTIVIDQTVDETMALALRAATGAGWTLIDSTPPSGRATTGRIEATTRSIVFGFPADVTVRIRPGVNETRVDVRSRSRLAGHDFGGNAATIESFQRQMDALSTQR